MMSELDETVYALYFDADGHSVCAGFAEYRTALGRLIKQAILNHTMIYGPKGLHRPEQIRMLRSDIRGDVNIDDINSKLTCGHIEYCDKNGCDPKYINTLIREPEIEEECRKIVWVLTDGNFQGLDRTKRKTSSAESGSKQP
jgi:hypothetical protein